MLKEGALIDTHCHLDHFDEDEQKQILIQAKEKGLGGLVTIGTRLSKAPEQKALTQYDTPQLRVWCAVGTHPNNVIEKPIEEVSEIVQIAQESGAIGIGETGLDYFYSGEDEYPQQQEAFRRHIQAARILDIPVIIHARNADEDIISILEEEYHKKPFRILLHCFASSPRLAQKVVDLGGYISFSGIVTFKKSDELRECAKTLPLERIVVETDAPFLAPVPKRGKRNQPDFVTYTASAIAHVRDMPVDDFITETTKNFKHLFFE